ncbi:Uncharacterised protein [uncultured archaeon]|nr:Uncharacterised protein [uncultured archaeon]
MRGQLSLEFLVVLAVYLAFVGALVSVQLHYIDSSRFASTKSHMQATLLSIEGTENAVNNRYLHVGWGPGDCAILGRLVLCGTAPGLIEIPLGYSEMNDIDNRCVS